MECVEGTREAVREGVWEGFHKTSERHKRVDVAIRCAGGSPVVLATKEVEIRRIATGNQPPANSL
jgi:hypothetical protein